MVKNYTEINVADVVDVAIKAGDAIMQIYNQKDFNIELKNDKSPLTIADMQSHEIIKEELQKLYPDIPVLSEEGKSIPFEERKNWKLYWLVDPLDGTREFIKRNGEFTVNIALMEDNIPVIGIIYAPVLNILYFSVKGYGAYKKSGTQLNRISVNKNISDGLTIVKSRSHSSPEENELLSNYKVNDSISVGSSLKFCMVAEGSAMLYFRFGPTWEWDTAAGNAIVCEAGGYMKGIDGNFPYNKNNMLNGSFIVSSFITDLKLPEMIDDKKN